MGSDTSYHNLGCPLPIIQYWYINMTTGRRFTKMYSYFIGITRGEGGVNMWIIDKRVLIVQDREWHIL